MTPAKRHLKLLTVFTVAARNAVDKLHDQYLTRSYPIDSDEFMKWVREDFEAALSDRLSGKETNLKKQIRQIMEMLLSHIYVSHWMLHQAYSGQKHTKTGSNIHSDLMYEARGRIEELFDTCINHAIDAVRGEPAPIMRCFRKKFKS